MQWPKAQIIRYRAPIIAFAVYLLIAFLRFPHITLNITRVVPGAAADTYGNLWDIWWVSYSLFTLHTSMLSTYLLFWPIGANLIYQTLTPIAAILTAPLQSVSLPLAYNALFFLGFALSGIGMFVLADHVTSNRYAAFIAGMIYTFSATHIMQSYIYLDWMFWGWIPLGLYFFLRILEEKRNYYNTLGFASAFFLAVFMGNPELGLIALIMYLFVLIAYLLRHETRKRVLRKEVVVQLSLAALLILALGSWWIVPTAELLFAKPAPLGSNVTSVANQLNTVQYNVQNSMDLLSFFLPDFYNGLGSNGVFGYYWKIFSVASIEKTGYLTYTAIALALIGLIKSRKKVIPWLVLGFVFAWLSTGPYLQIAGNNTGIPGPYLMYHSVQLVNIIREPGRFITILIMALSIIAACGYVEIEKAIEKSRYKPRINKTCLLVAAISILFLMENLGSPITNSAGIKPFTTAPVIPSFYYSLGKAAGNFSVLQLPAIPSPTGETELFPAEASYYTLASLKPTLGGYITRMNYTEIGYLYNLPLVMQAHLLQYNGTLTYMSPVNGNYTNQTLLFLYNFKTKFVVINKAAYNNSDMARLDAYLTDTFGASAYEDNSTIAFETGNAIQRSLFKSFVAFPVLSDWSYVPIGNNGNTTYAWSPYKQGLLAVYAPSPGDVSFNSSSEYNKYTTNATLSFSAMSTAQSAQLEIGEQTGAGDSTMIETLNITSVQNRYTVRLNDLTSGTRENYVMFVPSNSSRNSYSNSSDIIIGNISISRS